MRLRYVIASELSVSLRAALSRKDTGTVWRSNLLAAGVIASEAKQSPRKQGIASSQRTLLAAGVIASAVCEAISWSRRGLLRRTLAQPARAGKNAPPPRTGDDVAMTLAGVIASKLAVSLRAPFAKQSPGRGGDCFVAKNAPRNDICGCHCFAAFGGSQ